MPVQHDDPEKPFYQRPRAKREPLPPGLMYFDEHIEEVDQLRQQLWEAQKATKAEKDVRTLLLVVIAILLLASVVGYCSEPRYVDSRGSEQVDHHDP